MIGICNPSSTAWIIFGKSNRIEAGHSHAIGYLRSGTYLYGMDLSAFKESLAATIPPAALSVYQQALWFDAKGDWHKAHALIQDLPDKDAAWIHAYLHRKEGDGWNADYWYNRAGRKRPSVSLAEEWDQIVSALL